MSTVIFLIFAFAAVITAEQVFDVLSTNLVISSGKGYEANGVMAKWKSWTGAYWWTIKLPIVAVIWAAAYFLGPVFVHIASPVGAGTFEVSLTLGFMIAVAALYAYAIWNNYSIAWRK